MYILCPHCKFKTPAGYVLCKHCGNPLPGVAQLPALLRLVVEGHPDGTTASLRAAPVPDCELIQGTTRLGRMTDNEIVVSDALASRHHAVIRRDEIGRYLIEDLQSANGTYLNGTRLTAPTPLKAGDACESGTRRCASKPRRSLPTRCAPKQHW